MRPFAVRALEVRDRDTWRAAYGAYARCVDSPVDDEIADRVWTWLVGPERRLYGIVAYAGDSFVGFAHVRPFLRTLDGNEAGYLDDLWIEPDSRGSGAARAIFANIDILARERGWTHVRWVTHPENARARNFYDRIAHPLELVTYRLDTSDRR